MFTKLANMGASDVRTVVTNLLMATWKAIKVTELCDDGDIAECNGVPHEKITKNCQAQEHAPMAKQVHLDDFEMQRKRRCGWLGRVSPQNT